MLTGNIDMISNIENMISNNLLGHACFVQDDTGNMVMCEITRADFYVSRSGTSVNLHLKRSGTQNFPHCVNLYPYSSSNSSKLPFGFINPSTYIKYYSELNIS